MINRNIKRLIRQKRLIQANNMYDSIFNDLSKDGRNLLKNIENYKYKVTQSLNVVSNDEQISKKIQGYIEDLNNISAFLYTFVFDMENYNIVDDYEKQIEFTAPKENVEEEIEENDKEVEEVDNEENIEEDIEENIEYIEEDIENIEEEDIDNEKQDEDFDDEDISKLFDKANENDENL